MPLYCLEDAPFPDPGLQIQGAVQGVNGQAVAVGGQGRGFRPGIAMEAVSDSLTSAVFQPSAFGKPAGDLFRRRKIPENPMRKALDGMAQILQSDSQRPGKGVQAFQKDLRRTVLTPASVPDRKAPAVLQTGTGKTRLRRRSGCCYGRSGSRSRCRGRSAPGSRNRSSSPRR